MTDRPSRSPSLRLRDVSVSFPDGPTSRTILDRLDLDLFGGELTVVSGRSGSGKSTLLTVAGLLRRPDSGEVSVAGAATSALRNSARTRIRREHVAFVYQSANLFPALTALEQLELVGHLRRAPGRASRSRARQLLDDLGLADRAGQLPRELSGGERQRVGIARALMAQPTILIADEPTASLDPERASAVAAMLAAATADRQIATLVVAHDTAALSHADHHLRLDAGHLQPAAAT